LRGGARKGGKKRKTVQICPNLRKGQPSRRREPREAYNSRGNTQLNVSLLKPQKERRRRDDKKEGGRVFPRILNSLRAQLFIKRTGAAHMLQHVIPHDKMFRSYYLAWGTTGRIWGELKETKEAMKSSSKSKRDLTLNLNTPLQRSSRSWYRSDVSGKSSLIFKRGKKRKGTGGEREKEYVINF